MTDTKIINELAKVLSGQNAKEIAKNKKLIIGNEVITFNQKHFDKAMNKMIQASISDASITKLLEDPKSGITCRAITKENIFDKGSVLIYSMEEDRIHLQFNLHNTDKEYSMLLISVNKQYGIFEARVGQTNIKEHDDKLKSTKINYSLYHNNEDVQTLAFSLASDFLDNFGYKSDTVEDIISNLNNKKDDEFMALISDNQSKKLFSLL